MALKPTPDKKATGRTKRTPLNLANYRGTDSIYSDVEPSSPFKTVKIKSTKGKNKPMGMTYGGSSKGKGVTKTVYRKKA